MKRTLHTVALATLSLVAGCAQPAAQPPRSSAEYDLMRRDGNLDYPPATIVAYNLQRVTDPTLPEPQRLWSLWLAYRLGGDRPVAGVACVANRPTTPPQLAREIRRIAGASSGLSAVVGRTGGSPGHHAGVRADSDYR